MKIDPRDAANVTAEPAVLVGVRMRGSRMDFADPLGELRALAETAGARVVSCELGVLTVMQPASSLLPRRGIGQGALTRAAPGEQ